MSSVIGGFFESGWCEQLDLASEHRCPRYAARYSVVESALAGDFVTAGYTMRRGTIENSSWY
ncbi:hypothetical protein [Mesorhizobium sp. M1406]|uniref:hypothetical protein n=1 Tax=Mesorhizobium sp. M1406 TaxID=2957099 RepID=UPI00333A6080